MRNLTFAIILSTVLASCAPQYGPYGNNNGDTSAMGSVGQMAQGNVTKQGVGTLAGAVGGAFVGKEFGKGSGNTLATAAGALVGGMIGSEIGKSLDNADRAYMMQTQQAALEQTTAGISTPWRNPSTGNSGTVTPTNYYNNNGTYCREFTQTINVGGQTERGVGTACRQPDGSWKIVN